MDILRYNIFAYASLTCQKNIYVKIGNPIGLHYNLTHSRIGIDERRISGLRGVKAVTVGADFNALFTHADGILQLTILKDDLP